jgi:hypothetical protein
VQQLRNKWQTMTRVAKHHQQHELLVDLWRVDTSADLLNLRVGLLSMESAVVHLFTRKRIYTSRDRKFHLPTAK